MLHKDISDILTMIDETGKYARDIKDLEDQVHDASCIFKLRYNDKNIKLNVSLTTYFQIRDNTNNVEEALKQVVSDLERIKEEQRILLKEIRKVSRIDETE